ncbi:hypothetical protein W97_08792 [Coniosporium apollinis CBS 100218]|uniref:CST complex subunit Ten1 n=1 Tax=Coniosporium apollinis (strain CBS 100218) TaxID=1168221 RepID=R7Z5U7_CONA1|nr:uncharacterized protein W97_08792 [Coniosporium apollinis CBS 100218]EON69532.1 hypothetical protein W97_08792 [Coniosporium apollinis CBS 100218]
MSRVPPASRLVFLSDLNHIEAGEKVRFLGCVEDYIVPSGTLVLKHNYPPTSSPIMAHVNINHVLESIKSTEMQTGAWLNVIGYVEKSAVDRPTRKLSRKQRASQQNKVHVQAVMLWSAGAVKVDAYERAVEQRELAAGSAAVENV